MISSCRMEVLKHFGADPSEYDCVFTSGSTAALKLVAECFPWGDKSALVYPYNAHTSVLGMREFSPSAYCVPSALFHDVSDDVLTSAGSTTGNGINDCGPNYCTSGEYYSLLVVPGECNFSGDTRHYIHVCALAIELWLILQERKWTNQCISCLG